MKIKVINFISVIYDFYDKNTFKINNIFYTVKAILICVFFISLFFGGFKFYNKYTENKKIIQQESVSLFKDQVSNNTITDINLLYGIFGYDRTEVTVENKEGVENVVTLKKLAFDNIESITGEKRTYYEKLFETKGINLYDGQYHALLIEKEKSTYVVYIKGNNCTFSK